MEFLTNKYAGSSICSLSTFWIHQDALINELFPMEALK